MADGLYAVFHRFEAFHRWPVYCWMSIQRPSCLFNLCSSCSSRSIKRRRDYLLPLPRGRLCCRAALTAPPYSRRWPSHPSTHPHLLLLSGDGRRTSKPSYSRTPLHVGNNCRVFPASVSFIPFLGLAVIHHPGALGAAWSMWSTTDMHLKWTVRAETDSWVHGRTQGNASLLRAK